MTVRAREDLVPQLKALTGRKVAVDPERSVHAIFTALEGAGAQVVELTDPTVLAKAIKNPVEQAGHRAAQARDGAAIARFLHWLSVEAPKGGETELCPPPHGSRRCARRPGCCATCRSAQSPPLAPMPPAPTIG